MKDKQDLAVSPVVGVMLMLVVVIIIASIVSAFAGGIVSSQKKAPQATFSGKFSLSDGFRISHDGGDSLAVAETLFVIRNGPTFGTGLEQRTAEPLNTSLIVNSQGNALNTTTVITPGDTLFITAANSTCSLLQPDLNTARPDLCLSNTTSIGKTFILEVSDTKGNLISKSDVTITP